MDKLAAMISSKSKMVADKAKVLADIAKKKGEIAACEETIKKNYLELGKMIYEEYERLKEAETDPAQSNGEISAELSCEEGIGQVPERYLKQCKTIFNAKRGIAELEKEIREMKQDDKKEEAE